MPAREGKKCRPRTLTLLWLVGNAGKAQQWSSHRTWGFFCCCFTGRMYILIKLELINITSPYWFEVIKCIKMYYLIQLSSNTFTSGNLD